MTVKNAKDFDRLDAKLYPIPKLPTNRNIIPGSASRFPSTPQPLPAQQSTTHQDQSSITMPSHDIVKRKGVCTTVENAKDFDRLDAKLCPLMALPYDLRHEILSYVCNAQKMPVFLRGIYGIPPTAVPLPSIARAGNRKLRAEVILVILKQTTLEIHSGPGNAKLQEWLESIDLSVSKETSLKSGFDAVHDLLFPYFSRYPHRTLPANSPNNDLQLMKKCQNLRKVEFNFVSTELHDPSTGWPKSIDQLRREYRLHTMLEIFKYGELKTVVLRGPSAGYGGHAVLEELGAWLRWEYTVRANLHAAMVNSSKKGAVKNLSVLIA